MSELYNRELHCGFSEPCWELSDLNGGREKPVLDSTSPFSLSSPNKNTTTKELINVMKDKEIEE